MWPVSPQPKHAPPRPPPKPPPRLSGLGHSVRCKSASPPHIYSQCGRVRRNRSTFRRCDQRHRWGTRHANVSFTVSDLNIRCGRARCTQSRHYRRPWGSRCAELSVIVNSYWHDRSCHLKTHAVSRLATTIARVTTAAAATIAVTVALVIIGLKLVVLR